MHPRQQQVVAAMMEMRYAALIRGEITHRRVGVDGAHATPAQAHQRLGIEVEAAHEAL
jgi:hypothetical protein